MGNASPCPGRRERGTVHPHVHGERFGIREETGERSGSSPRAWGTHVPACVCDGCSRFIPTCMGNAFLLLVFFRISPVHPHVHGERSGGGSSPRQTCGSSPRAWGTHCADADNLFRCRFIPTCMGNARRISSSPFRMTVHPHVHGERVIAVPDRVCQTGSSPRAWGTLSSKPFSHFFTRFIPTCMGNATFLCVFLPY